MEATHDDAIREKNLPRVGQTAQSKDFGTQWRVMEKREVWLHTSDNPKTGSPRMLPAIYLTYWRIKKGLKPGIGKMLGYAYTIHDNTFDANWEIVEEK